MNDASSNPMVLSCTDDEGYSVTFSTFPTSDRVTAYLASKRCYEADNYARGPLWFSQAVRNSAVAEAILESGARRLACPGD